MRLCRVVLPVADIEGAARFYAAVLGVAGERDSPGRHDLAGSGDSGATARSRKHDTAFMPGRTDKASKRIRAPASAIGQAFATPGALQAGCPLEG